MANELTPFLGDFGCVCLMCRGARGRRAVWAGGPINDSFLSRPAAARHSELSFRTCVLDVSSRFLFMRVEQKKSFFLANGTSKIVLANALFRFSDFALRY